MTTLSGAVFLLLCILMHSHGQEIIISPQGQVAFLNQEVVFTCVTSGGDISGWFINGTGYSELPNAVRNDLKRTDKSLGPHDIHDLIMPGRADYNGTRIKFVIAVRGNEPVESETASLTLQGILSSVVNLETDCNASSITVSWSAPFSLDVTGVDPDIWYSVLIYNVTDEENPTVVPCTDCHNLTQTHYIFNPDYPSPYHKYAFTVIPFNGVLNEAENGEGESSQNVTNDKCVTKTTPSTSSIMVPATASAISPSPTPTPTPTPSNNSAPDKSSEDNFLLIITVAVVLILG